MLSAAVLLALTQFSSAQQQNVCDCNESPAPNTPLNDLGQRTYSPGNSPAQGGLYPNGYNQRPGAYNTVGLNLTTDSNGIVPRNQNGEPSPNGKIVMISIGMCNTTKEFGGIEGDTLDHTKTFVYRVMTPDGFSPAKWKHPKLVVVDCAQGHMSADLWAQAGPSDDPWKELQRRLHDNVPSVSAKQVQVIWLKEALADPASQGGWPAHVNSLQGNLETILDNLIQPSYGFGNVKMVFLSPRTRAWTTTKPHSPEPFAYETGFADQRLIKKRITDPARSSWPWLSWGPYLWADGNTARSDGLTWLCSDLVTDCVHPTDFGVIKVVDQLLAFFRTDPVATPWFLKSGGTPPTNVSVSLLPLGGIYTENTSVMFTASATPQGGNITEWVWTYDDGTFASGQTVTKAFPARSESGNPYKVHLTVIDSDGDSAFKDTQITVTAGQARLAPVEETKHRTSTLPPTKQGAARNVSKR